MREVRVKLWWCRVLLEAAGRRQPVFRRQDGPDGQPELKFDTKDISTDPAPHSPQPAQTVDREFRASALHSKVRFVVLPRADTGVREARTSAGAEDSGTLAVDVDVRSYPTENAERQKQRKKEV